MWSICGFTCGGRDAEDDREPLLPVYNDDTARQAQLRRKLHTYQMLRALSQGYMPSNEQIIINLRVLLSSPLLTAEDYELSEDGQEFVYDAKQWLKLLMGFLQHKNGQDQIQDFVWYLSKARVSVDTGDLARAATRSRAKADTKAAYESMRTVGSLLLTNSHFRVFLADLNTMAKEVLQDAAFSLSKASKEAGKKLEPSQAEQEALKSPNGKHAIESTSANALTEDVVEVGQVLAESAGQVAGDVQETIVTKATGDEKDTLLYRLKQTVTNLRKRPDYATSVSTLSMLLRRWALAYAHIGQDIASTLEDDVHPNDEVDRALKNFWSFLTSFGDRGEWEEVERLSKAVLDHGREDPQFDDLIRQSGNILQDMLMDPAFFDNAEENITQLRQNFRELTTESSLRDDLDHLLEKISAAVKSFLRDEDVAKLLEATKRVAKILSPTNQYVNGSLLTDAINFFIPLAIETIQYIPIPRLEISTPAIDLLLENLILQPGRTVNNTSFLPYKLRVETQNNFEIRKARFAMTSKVESYMTIKIAGMSISAEDMGFWLRAHSGLLRLADQGIASFHLDERGIDIELDVEIAKERLEQMLTLRAVRVKIHKLTYTLRRSKFSLLGWLFKPLLQPIVRLTLEMQLAAGIADAIHAGNRELLYARERLRATRIANPDDLWTFAKAVTARLMPEADPDLDVRVGVEQPGRGVFRGVYAPGSVVKLWHEEATHATRKTREYARDGWRNDIFDVVTVPAM